MTALLLAMLMVGCRLDALTDGGSLYTTQGLDSNSEPCGFFDGVQRYCLVGECVDAATRTCRGYPCPEEQGRLYTYDAYDGDMCPVFGGHCTSGDYCDPRRRGCIATTAICTDEIERF